MVPLTGELPGLTTQVLKQNIGHHIFSQTHTHTHINDVKKSVPQLMGVSRCVPGAQVVGHNTTPPLLESIPLE